MTAWASFPVNVARVRPEVQERSLTSVAGAEDGSRRSGFLIGAYESPVHEVTLQPVDRRRPDPNAMYSPALHHDVLGGVDECAAGFDSAGPDERVQPRPGEVEGCRVPAGPNPSTDDIVKGLLSVGLVDSMTCPMVWLPETV